MFNPIFTGHLCLRERLFLSFFSGKPVYIENIRISTKKTGLRDYEINLLSLIDKLTHSSIIQLNEQGTHLRFSPGCVNEGNYFHNTNGTRSLSYYLEFLIYLIPSLQKKMNVKLLGVRSLKAEISLEAFSYVNFALFRKIGPQNLRLRIMTSSISKTKNTEVVLFCPRINHLNSFQYIRRGSISNLQIIFTTSSNSILSHENLSTILSKKILNHNLNFKIHNYKVFNSKINFKTITIIAETSTGCILSKDFTITRKNLKFNQWIEFYRGIFSEFMSYLISGYCIDNHNQVFFLVNSINVSSGRISEIRVKKLTLSTIYFLRDCNTILGPIFKIKYLKSSKNIAIQKKI